MSDVEAKCMIQSQLGPRETYMNFLGVTNYQA